MAQLKVNSLKAPSLVNEMEIQTLTNQIKNEKLEIKLLKKQATGMQRQLAKAQKGFDENLRANASTEDLLILDQIKSLKKQHAELLTQQEQLRQEKLLKSPGGSGAKPSVKMSMSPEQKYQSYSQLADGKSSAAYQIKLEQANHRKQAQSEHKGSFNADLASDFNPVQKNHKAQYVVLLNEVKAKEKQLKLRTKAAEAKRVEHGRRLAEIFDNEEVMQVNLRKAQGEADLVAEELGDLQFLMMQEQIGMGVGAHSESTPNFGAEKRAYSSIDVSAVPKRGVLSSLRKSVQPQLGDKAIQLSSGRQIEGSVLDQRRSIQPGSRNYHSKAGSMSRYSSLSQDRSSKPKQGHYLNNARLRHAASPQYEQDEDYKPKRVNQSVMLPKIKQNAINQQSLSGGLDAKASKQDQRYKRVTQKEVYSLAAGGPKATYTLDMYDKPSGQTQGSRVRRRDF